MSSQAELRYSVIKAKQALEEAVQKYLKYSQEGRPGSQYTMPEHVTNVVRCKANYLRLGSSYAALYGSTFRRHQLIGVAPIEPTLDANLLKQADIFNGFFHNNRPAPVDVLELPGEIGSATNPIMVGDGVANNFVAPEFRDKSGKIRQPTYAESARVMAHILFHKYYSARVDQALRSGEPVPVKMRESFTLFLMDMLEIHGITPNSAAASASMFSEFLILYRDRADKLLADEIRPHFGDPAAPAAANMRAPVGVPQEEKRRQLLRTLEMDPTNLTPPLAEFQKQVLMAALDPTKWREFVANSGLTPAQAKALFALAQNTNRTHVDIPVRQQWVDSANAAREGKEGQNILEKAGFYRAVRDSNTLRKAATTEDKTIALAAITSVVTNDAVSTAARGEVNATTVGNSIQTKIIAAYGTPSADMKHTIAVSKTAAEAAITRGNAEIKAHAEKLSVAAASSLVTCRFIFGATGFHEFSAAAVGAVVNATVGGYRSPLLGDFPGNAGVIANALMTNMFNAAVLAQGGNPGGAIPGNIQDIANAASSAAWCAITRAAAARNVDLQSGDAKRIAAAKTHIALVGAVTSAIGAIVMGTGALPLATIANAEMISIAIIDAIPHGQAAVTHAIRTTLAGIIPAVAAADRERLTQTIAESAGVGFAVQKGESAAQRVWAEAEAKAVEAMVAIQVPKPMAADLARRLSLQPPVNEAAVRAEIVNARNYVNTVCDEVEIALDGQWAHLGIHDGVLANLRETIQEQLLQRYWNNGFTAPNRTRAQVIETVIDQTVKNYNQRLPPGHPQRAADWPFPEELTNAAQAIDLAIRGVDLGVIAAPDDDASHEPAPTEDHLSSIINAVVPVFNVSDKMVEARVVAAAQEAGVKEADAKAVGSEAKVAVGDASVAAVNKLPVSKDIVAAAVVAVLAKNGSDDAVARAQENAQAVQAGVMSAHSHDRVAAAADIAAITAAAIADANLEIQNPADRISDVDIALIAQEVEDKYVRQDGNISAADVGGTTRITALRDAAAVGYVAAHVAVLDKVEKAVVAAAKIQKGIDVGKETALVADTKSAPLASAIASVASGAGVEHKGVIMAIARDISKHYADNKETIDDKTAREKMKGAVDLLNTKAGAIEQAALELAQAAVVAETGGLGLPAGVGLAANAVSTAIRNHYLASGSLTETDVTRLVYAHGGVLPAGVTPAVIKTFYNQVKQAETSTVASNPVVPAPAWYARLTVTQENALAQMAVEFASKTDPAAVGSAVGRAAVQLEATPENAAANLTVVSALAIRGLGGRTGATLDHADIGNAVLAGRVGTRAAARHTENLGAAAAVAAAGSTVRADFAGMNHADIALAAQVAYIHFNGVGPGAVEVYNAVHDAAHAALEQMAIAAHTPLFIVAGGAATFGLPPPAVPDLPKGVPYGIPAGTEKTVAQSVGIAGAIVVAAMKAGFSPAQAQAMATAVARPEIVAGGLYAISKKLGEEVRRLNPSLPAATLRELTLAACGGYGIGQGMERVNHDYAGAPGDPEPATRGDELVRIITETAIAAGATPEAAAAAAQKAKEAMPNSEGARPGVAPFIDVTADEAKLIATVASASLREADFMEAAFAVGSSLSFALTPGADNVKALAASTTAGASQVTDAESQLAARSAEELAKKIRTGELHNEAAQLAARKQLLAAHAELGQKYGDPPDPQSIDMEHHIHKDQILDAAHADTWTVSYEDGSGRRVALGDDPVLKDCAEALKACCDAEGNSYVTEATVKQAVTEFNKGVRDDQKIRLPQDIKDNGKGGLHLNFHNLVPSQVRDLLMLVAKKSKLTMTPATVEASRPRFGGS